MKEVKFETIKGEFIAVEIPDSQRYDLSRMADKNDFYRLVCKLSEATEEDASEVVIARVSKSINTHLLELHFILKSKGVDSSSGNWYLFKKI